MLPPNIEDMIPEDHICYLMDGIRYIKAYPEELELNAMRAKMKTQEAKERYRIRKQSVEAAIGDIKENKGVRSFLTRGIKRVKSEFDLICAACNIKRIWEFLLEQNRERKAAPTKPTQLRVNFAYLYQFANTLH